VRYDSTLSPDSRGAAISAPPIFNVRSGRWHHVSPAPSRASGKSRSYMDLEGQCVI